VSFFLAPFYGVRLIALNAWAIAFLGKLMIVPARRIIATNVDKLLRRQDLLRRNRTVERNRIDRALFNVYKRSAVLQAKAERGVRILAVAFWTAFHKRG